MIASNPGRYEVIIIGLGAMGSAAAFHLAMNGNRVLGLDRFQPPHPFGSSHGRTRIIREAYFEHPSYVPLVQRAYDLWLALENKSGRKLLMPTGGLMIGPPNGALVTGARRSAEEHKLEHQILSSAELRCRFSVFQPDEDTIAVWEPRAGILFPEKAIQAHLEVAAQNGASIKFNEPVLTWETDGQGVRVITAENSYRADRLLIASGAWLGSLLNPAHQKGGASPESSLGKVVRNKSQAELTLPLSIERQVLFWFEPVSQAASFSPRSCPIYIWEYEPGRFFYGFPDLGDGIKVAFHHQGELADPDLLRREVGLEEIERMKSLLSRFVPKAAGRLSSQEVCMYTNTTDEHFIFDWHPMHDQVLVASPCSGHGFKFSSVLGELASKLLTGVQVDFDLGLFEISRFGKNKA